MNLSQKIEKLLDDKKAADIKIISIEERNALADYFIIASGSSSIQVKALCDHLEEELEKEEIRPRHIEGYNEATWILMDYGDVIVHIFYRETREFYSLEDIWTKTNEMKGE